MENKEHLRKLVYENARKLYDKIPEERIEYELGVINSCNFTDYFLVLAEVFDACKKENIYLSPSGRGSGAGSVVNYCLGITGIDPVLYNLPFERFLNRERVSPPDIDTDVATEDRPRLLDLLARMYGSVAQIGTIGTLGAKSVVKDVLRAMDVPFEASNRLVKDLPIDITLEQLSEDQDFIDRYEALPLSDSRFTWKAIHRLCGLAKSRGRHAGGVIVSDIPINNYIPCWSESDGSNVTTEFDMHYVEDMKFVKYDFLGLRTLGVLKACEEQTGIKFADLKPFDDAEVYEKIFKTGNTVGVFQAESKGFSDMLARLEPKDINDLSLGVALYRPTGLEWTFDDKIAMEHIIDRRKGTERTLYLFPEEEEYLSQSNGVVIYQEMLMAMVRQMTGCSLGRADITRKIVGKKQLDKIEGEVAWFKEEAMKHRFTKSTHWDDINWRQRVVNQCADSIVASGRYCFNGKEKLDRKKRTDWTPTIEEMYKIKNDIEYAKSTGHLELYKKYKLYGYGKCLSYDFEKDRILQNTIIDIQPSGVQQTYKITTESGRTISLTENHELITNEGTVIVKNVVVGMKLPCKGSRHKVKRKYNLTDKERSDNMPTKGQRGFQKLENSAWRTFTEYRKGAQEDKRCECCGKYVDRIEVHHKDFDHTNNSPFNLEALCVSCHKKKHYDNGRTRGMENGYDVVWEEIISVEPDELIMTYDITASGDISHTVVNSDGIAVFQCFNKSHSMCYASLTYATAYYKCHYPEVFYCATLNSLTSNPDRMRLTIKDAKENGVQVLPPDINLSNVDWTPVGKNQIAFGLGAIKGISKASDAIILDRETNGKYNSVEEFCLRLKTIDVNKTAVKNLAKAGAFDNLWNNRCSLVASIDELCKMRTNRQKTRKRKSGDYTPTVAENLALLAKNDKSVRYTITEVQDDSTERAMMEMEVLQYFITANPLDKYREEIKRYNPSDKPAEEQEGEFYFCGTIQKIHTIPTKKGDQMCFLTVASEDNTLEFTMFPKPYKESIPSIYNNNVVVVKAKRSDYQGKVGLQAEYVRDITVDTVRGIKEIYWRPSNIKDVLGLMTVKSNLKIGGGTEFYIVTDEIILKSQDKIIVDNKTITTLEEYGTVQYHQNQF